MAFRTASWITLVLMILGIILTVIGVSFYEAYIDTNKSRAWWIWLLIGLGLFLSIGGAVATMVLLSLPETPPDSGNIGMTPQVSQMETLQTFQSLQ